MEAVAQSSAQRVMPTDLSIGQHASSHCEVSVTVGVGETAMTREGHVVRRVTRSEWEVLHCPPQALYQFAPGTLVLGRVVFWRMNGLCQKLS